MFWFLIVLIAAGLIYSLYDIKNYQASLEDARGRIQILEAKADKFDKTVAIEKKKNRDIVEMLRQSREIEAELKNEYALTMAQVKTEQRRESELEMDMYKKEFKSNKQRNY